jgi:hypothetical protein
LKTVLQTVETLAQQKQQQHELERQVAELDRDIRDYGEFWSLQANVLPRLEAITALQHKLATLQQEESTLVEKKKAQAQSQANLKIEQDDLLSQHRRINQARQQRLDQQPPFTFLEQLPYLPCMEAAELAMPTLAYPIEN